MCVPYWWYTNWQVKYLLLNDHKTIIKLYSTKISPHDFYFFPLFSISACLDLKLTIIYWTKFLMGRHWIHKLFYCIYWWEICSLLLYFVLENPESSFRQPISWVQFVFLHFILKYLESIFHQPIKLSAGPRLNIKTVLSMYGDFHVKDKTAVRTSYL